LLAVVVVGKQLVAVAVLGDYYKDLPLCLLALCILLLLDLAALGQWVVVVMVQDPELLAVIVNIPLLLLMAVVVVEITTVHQMMLNQEDLEAVLVLRLQGLADLVLWDRARLVELLIIIIIPGLVAVVPDTLVVMPHLV
jgi:hypothetical protein